jgi:hypothetical protein
MAQSIFKRIFWALTEKDASTFLRSKEDNDSEYFSNRVCKKASEVEASRISTYPRFTVFDKSIQKKEDQLIFDSSDFFVINKTFGIFDDWKGVSIVNERRFKFRDKEYIVTKVQVDFLGIFDDYTMLSPFGHRHSEVYEGEDTPYNIQIFIEVLPMDRL